MIMRKFLPVIPVILLGACARTDQRAAAPQPGAGNPPVGYAAASSALKSPDPATSPGSSANPEPVAPNDAPGGATDRSPGAMTIPRGTPIHVRLDETIDTRRNRAGDVVHAT